MAKIVERKVRGSIRGTDYKYRLEETKQGDYIANLAYIEDYNNVKFITKYNKAIYLGEENPKETFENLVGSVLDHVEEKKKDTSDDVSLTVRFNDESYRKSKDDKTFSTADFDINGATLNVDIEYERKKMFYYKGFSISVDLYTSRKKYRVSNHIRHHPSEYNSREVNDAVRFSRGVKKRKLKLKTKPPFIKQESNFHKAEEIYENSDDIIKNKIDEYISQYD